MSLDATLWAWQQKVTPTQKLVLLALADRSGENHDCYPSHERLMLDTGLSNSGVRKALRELAQLGLIKIIQRNTSTNIYQLIGVKDRCQKDKVSKPLPDDGVLPKNGGGSPKNRGVLPKNGAVSPNDIKPTTQPLTQSNKQLNNSKIQKNEKKQSGLLFHNSFNETEKEKALKLLEKVECAQDLLDELAARLNNGGVRNKLSYLQGLIKKLNTGQFEINLGETIKKARDTQRLESEQFSNFDVITNSNVWADCKLDLSRCISSKDFHTYILCLQSLETYQDLKLFCPNRFVLEWIKQHALHFIQQCTNKKVHLLSINKREFLNTILGKMSEFDRRRIEEKLQGNIY